VYNNAKTVKKIADNYTSVCYTKYMTGKESKVMYRKITHFFEEWKNSPRRKPLIVQGARQVGKTYSILEFGRTHYENVAYFNFERNEKLKKLFDEDISPAYLVPLLSHVSGQTIVKEKTLIVLDEIQACERALTSLKYFCEEAPEYHILVAGSLLGVAVIRNMHTIADFDC